MIHCGLRLLNINEIDPVKFSFSVNVAYIFNWLDSRVKIKNRMKNKSIALDQDFISKIWKPKFSTIDLQESRPLGTERDGLKVRKVDKSNNTEIQYTTDAMVVFKCPINYSLFPFHIGTCKLRITSQVIRTIP